MHSEGVREQEHSRLSIQTSFERAWLVITEEPFLAIEGQMQNTDNVVLVKAEKILPLTNRGLAGSESHDFR